jgi:hypothetical protein
VPPVIDSQEDRDRRYFTGLVQALRLYFDRLNAVQQLNVAKLNINLDTLPTEADVANLRAGDVYRDTTASNVLKVKT